MRRIVLPALVCAGCLTPRSVMLQQMAAPSGKGGLEIGIGTGVGYAVQVQPPTLTTLPNGETQSLQQVSSTFALPAFEGNAHFGLTDRVGFNAHFSSAGVQPGVKITLNKSKVANVALMPQVALGYGAFRGATYASAADGVQMETSPGSTTMLTFMLGLRFLISHRSGFFMGIGYDFVLTRSATTGTIGSGNTAQMTSSLSTSLQHSVMLNVGFSVTVNWLRIRPELAVAVVPAISTGFSNGMQDFSSYGGYGFAVLPGFSLTAVTPVSTRDEGAEEDERNVGPGDEAPPERERERDRDDAREEGQE